MIPEAQLRPLREYFEARRKATTCAKCGTPYEHVDGQRRCRPCRNASRRAWKRGAKQRERAERRLGHYVVSALDRLNTNEIGHATFAHLIAEAAKRENL